MKQGSGSLNSNIPKPRPFPTGALREDPEGVRGGGRGHRRTVRTHHSLIGRDGKVDMSGLCKSCIFLEPSSF